MLLCLNYTMGQGNPGFSIITVGSEARWCTAQTIFQHGMSYLGPWTLVMD